MTRIEGYNTLRMYKPRGTTKLELVIPKGHPMLSQPMPRGTTFWCIFQNKDFFIYKLIPDNPKVYKSELEWKKAMMHSIVNFLLKDIPWVDTGD